ncbi:MAG: YciI family protein [bacterium]
MKSDKTGPRAVSLLTLLLVVVAGYLASVSRPISTLRAETREAKSVRTSAQDTTAAAPAKYFIAIFSLGSAWQKDKPAHEQLYFKEHSANLRKWREEKKIVVGARYSDKGMIVLSARDEAEARAWLAGDPMVENKVFNLEIYPFNPFYTGCIEKNKM